MTNTNIPILRIVEQGDAAYKKKDYETAERLYKQALDLAKRTGAETNYVYSALAKVTKRKSDGLREAYNYSRQTCTPAGFRDGAIALRKLARQVKKEKNVSLLRETLEELYRLAVLAYLCYGTHDCKSGFGLYDRAVIVCQMLELRQINATYQTHGTLEGGGLLTETDYKLYASVFGETDKTYNPLLDFAILTREVNDRYVNWLRDYYMRAPDDSDFVVDAFWIKLATENFNHSIESLRKNFPWAIND